MTAPPPTPPSAQGPHVLATATDRLFFDHLLQHGPDTRARIASTVGLSRPTASEAARRLGEAGLVTTTHRPTERAPATRGRTPEFYDIAPTYGHSLALAAAPGRAVARAADLRGTTLHESVRDLPERMTPAELEETLRALAAEASLASGSPCLAATASQGNPVAPTTQQPIALSPSPFPEGHGDVLAVLRTVCDGPVRIDNDVNWATLAEHRLGAARALADAVLLYLGPGVGAGVLLSGTVQRGHHGTGGELGYLRRGKRTLMSLLLEHGGAIPGTERLDVPRIRGLFANDPTGPRATRFIEVLAEAVSNITTFLDPQALILTGPLAQSSSFVAQLTTALHHLGPGGDPEVILGELGGDAPLLGAGLAARKLALDTLWDTYRS